MHTGRSYGRLLAGFCLAGIFSSGALQAAVSPEEAEKLGGEKYTCLGAERAGNDRAVFHRLCGIGPHVRELGDVGTGGEGLLAGPGEDHAAQPVVRFQNPERVDKADPGVQIQRVALFGIGQNDTRDRTVALER